MKAGTDATKHGVARGTVCVLLALIWARAQADEATTLDRVQVMGTRVDALHTPASVAVVRASDRRAGASGRAVSDLLTGVPGLLARPRQNFAQDEQISVRGFGTRSAFGLRGLRLYLDGIPATAPDGQGQVSNFNPSDLARIEVMRGPFSALYGNAAGGVVLAESRSGRDMPGTTLQLQAGGGPQWLAAAGVGGFDEAGDWRVSGTLWQGEGEREHSRARRRVLSARVAREPAEGRRVTWIAQLFDSPEAQDPQGLTREQARSAPGQASPSALAFDTRKTARQAQLGMVLEQDAGDGTLRLAAHAGERRVFQMLSTPVAAQRSPLSAGGVVQLASPFAGVDARWSGTRVLRGRPVQWALGVEAQWQLQHRQGFENFVGNHLGVPGALRLQQDDRVRALDPYAQFDWQANDALTLSAGLRHTRLDFDSRDFYVAPGNPDDSGTRRFSALTPVLGANLRLSDVLDGYVAWGRGVETPTSNELAYRGDGGSGPNFDLQAARTRSAETGLKFATGVVDAQLALFESLTRGELTAATSTGGRTTYRNAGRARRRGAEVSADWHVAPAWTVSGQASWLDARFVDGFVACSASPCTRPDVPVPAGTRLPGTAPRTAYLALRHGAATGWQFAADAQYVGPVRVAQADAEEAAGYALFGVQAGYAWRGAASDGRVRVGVANVADRRYTGSVIVNESNRRYYEPGPGRRFSVDVEWHWR